MNCTSVTITEPDISSRLTQLYREYLQKYGTVIRYLVAGGYNTLFAFLVFAGLYLLLEHQLHYLLIALVSQVIAITNAFLVYRYLVFKSDGNFLAEYFRTYLVYGVSFLVNLGMLAALVEVAGLHPILAQGLTVFVTVIISYFGHSRFTFRRSDP
ncbi:MAG: GtrA family protein [Proteobacteria bacterium]|nr:GtrA family protein [Pseudomonadota bacterium]